MTDKTDETNELDAKIAAENKKLKEQIAKLTEAQKASAKEAEEAREAAEEAAEAKARAANDLQALEASLAKKFQKQIEAAKKEAEGFKAQLAERDASLQTLLIDNALTAQMAQHNVAPALQPALIAMLKGQASLEGTEALIDGKPLADYMTSFVGSEQGKAFVLAPQNSGGGAVGGSGVSTEMTKENFDLTEFMKIAAADPARANALADSLGRPELKA